MTKRITTRRTGLPSRSAYDAAVDELAQIIISIRIREAKRDKHLQAVRDEYGTELDDLVKRRDSLLTIAEGYVFDHRDELFAKGIKSGSTTLATYGLRIGQPTLKTLNRRWTWAKVLDAVKAAFGNQYVDVKETLDKDGLKADLSSKSDELAKVGCRIDQTEAFWIEPKDGPEVLNKP